MVKDAEANADSDKERRALAEAKNQAEGLAHKAEKDLEEHGDKIEEADRETIKTSLGKFVRLRTATKRTRSQKKLLSLLLPL